MNMKFPVIRYLHKVGGANFPNILFTFLLLVGISITAFVSPAFAAAPTNYNSGISLLFSGEQGTDWDEEVFWYKYVQDDHKVVYIKADTEIVIEHNDRNSRQTYEYPNYLYDIGADGGGLIRYRVDRDLQIKYNWSGTGYGNESRYPTYNGPFAFSELNYGPEDPATPVVGTTGPCGIELTERSNCYFRGILDEFGDEWHTIAFADDDEWITLPPVNERYYPQNLASDGKTILFVVNPKTPSIKFHALTSDAQFYTTPAKAYFVPKVHAQTTYLTDDVLIELGNIMGGDVYYRFNGDSFQVYSEPINSNTLNNGTHILEYYYNDSYHKTRTIVKNPAYPSTGEEHGCLLWNDNDEFNAIKERVLSTEPAREIYRKWYSEYRNYNFNNDHHVTLGEGQRRGSDKAIVNAFVAKIEGYDAIRTGDSKTFANYAKDMLLDNVRKLDPLGFGDFTGQAIPSREINNRGYYDVNIIFSNAFAYDLLINEYRADQHSGGITPIEDYKIRDQLAAFALEALMQMGNYGWYFNLNNKSGMWGAAREIGAVIVALAMPSYNTPYYGTSGFDGTSTAYEYTPFPNFPLTWKQALYDEDRPLRTFPDMVHRFGLHEQFLTESMTRPQDGVTIPAGSFTDRRGYYGVGQMGHTFYILANVLKMKFDRIYPYMELAFEYANKGRLYGVKGTGEDLQPSYFPQLMLVNERFPNLAQDAYDYMASQPDGSIYSLDRQMFICGIYSLIFYHDDWVELSTFPTAEAGEDQALTDDNGDGYAEVVLDGSDSTDSDGNIVSWVWTNELTETIGTGEVVTTALSVGECMITLTVTDNTGATDSDTVVVTVTAPVEPQSSQIIIDHTAVEEFDAGIPQFYIDEVKKMLLNYPGESHGNGMLTGLRLVEQLDSRFAVAIRTEGAPEEDTNQYLRVHRPTLTQYGWNPWGTGEEDTWTNQAAIDTLNNHFAYARDVLNNPFDAFAFGWCWDMTWHNAPGGGVDPVYNVRWAGSSVGGPDGDLRWGLDADDTALTGNTVNLQNYLDAWIYYEQNNPDMTVIYSTGPVDYTGEMGYQVYLKHEKIREWVRYSQDRILFDYGDILTYNNSGVQNTTTWDGHTYPLKHPENTGEEDPFGYGSGHLSNEGYLKVAKAMWVLLAKKAGWDGITSGQTSYSLTITANGSGSVTKTPDKATYALGESVIVQAHPDSGHQFDSWSGDLTGSSTTATVTMNSNMNITANFVQSSVTPTTGDITEGLALHYSYGTADTVAQDSSGNNHTATLVNGPIWTTDGVINGALVLDGIDDYVNTGNDTFGLTNELTISAWIYVNGNGTQEYQTVIQRGIYAFPFIIVLENHNIQTCIRTINGTDWLSSNTSLAWGQWHHIAITYESGSRTIYINGSNDATDSTPPTGILSADTGYDTLIGSWGDANSHLFNGIVDEVRIYNRVLSNDEISALYNESIPTPTNNPPTAGNDSATVDEDSANNTIDVLANDTDADGDTLTITSVTQAIHGSVAITGGGTGLTYSPTRYYNGSDSFTYTISDGQGGIDTATVSITVIPAPPTVISATAATKFTVEVVFSEYLEQASAENIDNYSVDNDSLSNPIVINSLELTAENEVTLYTTGHTETEVVPYTLTVANVKDLTGNSMIEDTIDYHYDDGLIGLWRFNDQAGNTAQDSSGYGNTATLVNGPAWTEQGDINFDGIDDAVEIPTNYWNVNSGTVTLWAYAEDLAGTHYLFGHTTDSGSDRIQLYTLDQNLNLGFGNSDELNIENLDSQAWHHFALTWDGTNYVVYVDGIEIEEASGSYTGLNNLSEFADIGNSGDVSFDNAFAGYIDDARVYDRALTLDEIVNVYLMSDESIRESKALAFEVSATYPDGTALIYSDSDPNLLLDDTFDGASFENGTFAWNPWYDQAGTYDITFLPTDQEQPEYSQTMTIVVEDVQLSDWYQTWLEHLGLL